MNLWLCPSFLSFTSFTENTTFVKLSAQSSFSSHYNSFYSHLVHFGASTAQKVISPMSLYITSQRYSLSFFYCCLPLTHRFPYREDTMAQCSALGLHGPHCRWRNGRGYFPMTDGHLMCFALSSSSLTLCAGKPIAFPCDHLRISREFFCHYWGPVCWLHFSIACFLYTAHSTAVIWASMWKYGWIVEVCHSLKIRFFRGPFNH